MMIHKFVSINRRSLLQNQGNTLVRNFSQLFSPPKTFDDLATLHLSNEILFLRPLKNEDLNALEGEFDSNLLKWFILQYPDCNAFVQEKLNKMEKKESVSFVIGESKTGKIIGTTSLYEIDFYHKRLEMGATWFGKKYLGQGYNPMAKMLLLEHLFEKMDFQRVQWKTDAENLRAKNSMLKMGFTLEGTLRYHVKTFTGRVRDSLVFSVIQPEWFAVKEVLKSRLR